jgi:hypothetical protein
MAPAAEKQTEHIGATKAVADHDHDLIHELSERIDAVWHYDQYIANAASDPELKEFWTTLKTQEQKTVSRLKELVADHVKKGCF